MDYVESYTLIWAGIFAGMALASFIFSLVGAVPRGWFALFAVVFLGVAFVVKPLIAALVL